MVGNQKHPKNNYFFKSRDYGANALESLGCAEQTKPKTSRPLFHGETDICKKFGLIQPPTLLGLNQANRKTDRDW